MEKIIPKFKESVFDAKLSDAVIDTVELGIDSIIDSDLAKSIPIIKTVVGVSKTVQNIHDRNLLKQTFYFIKAFNSKDLSKEKKEKYLRKLKENNREEEELGRVLILLNRTIDKEKSRMIGNLFTNYLKELIDWSSFTELTQIIENIYIGDIDVLISIYKSEIKYTTYVNRERVIRLKSLGLLNSSPKSIRVETIGSISKSVTDEYVQTNEFGKMFITNIL